MKAIYLLSFIVILGIASSVNSKVCKCGTSVDSSCCNSQSNCYRKSFFNPHHCDAQNRVASTQCSKQTPFCQVSAMENFADNDNAPVLNTTTETHKHACKCGHFEYSYSCCEDDSECSSSFFVQHCPVQKRVQGCNKQTAYCKKSMPTFDSMYTAMIDTAPIEEFGVCKCGLTNVAYSCCAAHDLCQVSFWKGHHCDTSNRVSSDQCQATTPFCSKKTLDQEVETKLHIMNEMAQNDKWMFENQEKAIEKQ